MQETIRSILGEHEKNYPEDKEAHDIATEDLLSMGKVFPGKPIIMHTAYSLDGHHDNKDRYRKNYDYGLTDKDKREIDDDILGLSEMASMLSDPRIIEDESDENSITENRALARDVIRHLKEKHKGKDFEKALEKELLSPLLNMFMEHLNQKDTILEHLLAPTIVKETEHTPEKYHSGLKATFFTPVLDSHQGDRYSKLLRGGR